MFMSRCTRVSFWPLQRSVVSCSRWMYSHAVNTGSCCLSRGPPLAAAPVVAAQPAKSKLAALTEQKLGLELRVPKVRSCDCRLQLQLAQGVLAQALLQDTGLGGGCDRSC